MTKATLQELSAAAGLCTEWLDYLGNRHIVAEDSQRAILEAMMLPCQSIGDICASVDRLRAEERCPPKLLTATRGQPVRIPGKICAAQLVLEGGETRDIALAEAEPGFVTMRAPSHIGYHRLEYGDAAVELAVSPGRALRPPEVAGRPRPWGVTVQLYSLNYGGGFGDFSDLARFCRKLASYGVDAVAVSPVAALFSARPGQASPYAPSSRLFLNAFYAPRQIEMSGAQDGLIDWESAGVTRLQELRNSYARFRKSGEGRNAFERFVDNGGDRLLNHARFEALDADFRPRGLTDWRAWPGGYADVTSAAVRSLTACDPAVEFHLYLQWCADCGLAAARDAAAEARMRIGLIADLTVGMAGSGSQAWSRPSDVLTGLEIGAPPDLLAPHGQTWGLTNFSPMALRTRGMQPFLETLRATLRHVGGIRLDHVMGLRRLWVVPEGKPPSAGAYLQYPLSDLLRLIALESHRHRAIVIGEDLGTVPPEFRAQCRHAAVAGMRVLWFERTPKGSFRAPARWDKASVAMTTTHDLATVAGWWQGKDIGWRAKLKQIDDKPGARSERGREKRQLWRAMLGSGAVKGPASPGQRAATVVNGAIAHVAGGACELALIAIEDILGLEEQPNLPGTTDQHPNWRRRLPADNGLDNKRTRATLRKINEIRRQVT